MSKHLGNLVSYCGLYCGACGIYQGKIKQAVESLRNVIGAYGFDKISSELAKWEQSFQHYSEFEKVMGGLIKLFGECPGCVDGGGNPSCLIRECCMEKEYVMCSDCAKMNTCNRIHDLAVERLQKIKTQSVEKWVEKIQRKVNAGYCYLDEKTK